MNEDDIKALMKDLQHFAKQYTCEDDPDFDIHTYADGDVEDAYDFGYRAARVCFARELLDKYFAKKSIDN